MKKAASKSKASSSSEGASSRSKKSKAPEILVGLEDNASLPSVSPAPSSEANQEAKTEQPFKIRPLVQDAKSKKKKKSAMNMIDFEKSLQSSKDLGTKYETEGQPSLLREIATFDKSRLKNVESFDDDMGSDDETIQRIKKKSTLSQKMLCFAFWDGLAYPVHKLKFIVLQIPSRDEVTLDFSCLSQLTDLTFAILADMKDKESARFNAVERIVLDGCFQVTDAGIGWLVKAFPKLKWLSLVGCSKITDTGLVTLAEECSDLVSVDLSSTGVHFLPAKWHAAEGMRMSGSSVLFPPTPSDAAAAKAKSKAVSSEPLKDKKENLVKVCILTKNTGTKSLLAAVLKEKQTTKPIFPKIECGFTVDGGLTATLVEADESLSSGLLTNRSIVVLTTELNDKEKIREESEYMRGLIMEALGKQPNTQFIIVGLHDDNAGIVPTDFIRDEVLAALEKIRTVIIDTNYSLSSVKEMPVSEQLRYSTAQALQKSLRNIKIKSLEVNVDKPKDVAKFFEEIGKIAESMDILEKITYTKQIYNWAKEFHIKCPADLSTGVHTLHQAAQVLLKNTQFTERLRPFGAVHFLASIGKLNMWQSKGQTYVASSTWLCNVLSVLLSPSLDGTTNQGSFGVLEDSAPVWTIDALKRELGNKKLDWAQVEKVINSYPYLWKCSAQTFTTLISVPEQPKMDENVFTFTKNDEKSKDRLNVGFLFALNHNFTSSILERILRSVIQICPPVHVWRRGVIIYDSVLAVMVAQTGKVLNLNAYLVADPTSQTSSGESNHKNIVGFVWNSFMKYRLAVVHELLQAGLVFEEIRSLSNALQPVPELEVWSMQLGLVVQSRQLELLVWLRQYELVLWWRQLELVIGRDSWSWWYGRDDMMFWWK
ncbi:hypothetical protein RRG08_016465 [Elysia crispata]|uniref:Uncharacterized protein n=1 Tax=Elysia crispata TaxID=231223 RepID=A0AAE0Y8U3_9GAST|nr:hypothetical protein RRG08_016465 [Elysia crispata]